MEKIKTKVLPIDEEGVAIEKKKKKYLCTFKNENRTPSEHSSNIPIWKREGTQIGY